MGLWGRFSQMFKGGPSQPIPKPYTEDPYFGDEGPGKERTFGTDEMAYNALQEMNERPLGFTPDELNAMYQPGAERINQGTAAALRRSSRGGAQSGAFGSGGQRRREGSILSGGAQAKATGQWNLQAMQAKTALQDRYKRISALESYTLPRLGMQAGAEGRRLGYDMGLNTLNQQIFQNAQRQYNEDMDWGFNELSGGEGSAYSNVMGNVGQWAGMMGCWVARSIYGADDPRWLVARHYVLYQAPKPIAWLYLRFGERFAALIDARPWAKRIVKPLFDWMLKRSDVRALDG